MDRSQTWRRRFQNLRRDPRGTIRRGSLALPRRWHKVFARWRLERQQDLGFIALRPSAAFSADYSDLWFLYRQVRQSRPNVVFEFGSGCSTVIFAAALRDAAADTGAAPGKLYSFETDARWLEVTRSTVPASLQSFVELRLTPLSVRTLSGMDAYVHEGLPDLIPDFAYVDGPALNPEVRAAGDLALLEDRLRPGFQFVVDGRTENVAFLQRVLRRRYAITPRPIFFNTHFELLE